MFIFPFSSVLCQRPPKTSNAQVKEEEVGDKSEVILCVEERGKTVAVGIRGNFNHQLQGEECRAGFE